MKRNAGLAARSVPLARPSWLPDSVWPFDTFGVRTDDSVLAVTDVGNGPALLFVHTGTWSFIWRDLILRLAADFRCICFNAPGNGRSTPVPGSATSLDFASSAVRQVIEELDLDEITLVLHDLGGPAGIAGARRIPQRVCGIVAMNAFGWRPAGAALRGMLAIMGSGVVREMDAWTGFLPSITATSFGVGRHFDDDSRRAFREGMGRDGRRAFHAYMSDARSCDELYRQVADALTGPFARLPVLTIFGERNDPFGFQRRWKTLFPGAVQVIVAKGNHFPMCDDPDLVAQTIKGWHSEHLAG